MDPSRSDRTPLLLHVFPSFDPGGAELRTVHLISGLGDSFRHLIWSLSGRTSAAERLSEEASVSFLEAPVSGGLFEVLRMRRLIRRHSPDLVLTHNWGTMDALLAAVTSGFRVIHHEDGFNADESERLKWRRNVTRRWLLPSTFRVMVPSHTLHAISTEIWKLSAGKVILIPNGVEVGRFPRADGNGQLRKELGIPSDAFVIGTVGHLRRVKRVDRMLEVLARLARDRDVHLMVVGDGSEREQLQGLAARLEVGSRTHLVGQQTEVAPFLRAFDVFVLSSDSEQQPICLLEAMTCGLPVVATDVGDISQMLPPEQSQFLVPVEEDHCPDLIAARLDELWRAPDLRQGLAVANQSRVRAEYSYDTMLSRHRDLYRLALQRE